MAETKLIHAPDSEKLQLASTRMFVAPADPPLYRASGMREHNPNQKGVERPSFKIEGKVWRVLTDSPFETLDPWLHLDFPDGLPDSLFTAPSNLGRVTVSISSNENTDARSHSSTIGKLLSALKVGKSDDDSAGLRMRIAEPKDIEIKKPAEIAGVLAKSLNLSEKDERKVFTVLGAAKLIADYWKMNARNSEDNEDRRMETFRVLGDRHWKIGIGPQDDNPVGIVGFFWHN